jgi:hypothetical protein
VMLDAQFVMRFMNALIRPGSHPLWLRALITATMQPACRAPCPEYLDGPDLSDRR